MKNTLILIGLATFISVCFVIFTHSITQQKEVLKFGVLSKDAVFLYKYTSNDTTFFVYDSKFNSVETILITEK